MKPLKSLRSKYTGTMLLVTGIIGLSTLAIMVFLSVQASSRHLASVERYIDEGITSKGKVLTENHALALRSLTLDNAFLDMQRLVARVVREDKDLVYGLYVNSQGQALAYTRRGSSQASEEHEQPEKQDDHGELGLGDAELLVERAVVRRVTRLGHDLLEVAVPVLGEEQELIGTIRYGLSTERVGEALARAHADAQSRLMRSVLLVGLLVAAAVGLGTLLSRIQSARITRPLTDLTSAAQALAAGNRGVHVDIRSGDELELLGASFNRMVEDLDASYRNLEEMNRTLEQKVSERTTELADKNRDMRLVLDNVDQGFVTLSVDGSMALQRSLVLGRWFGDSACSHFWDYIAGVSTNFSQQFELAWQQLMDAVLPLEACLAQLPERLDSGGRTWSFRYLPFQRDGQLEGVLLVIAEITERLAKAREEAEQNELMQSFKRLMLDRSGFERFVREASQMIASLSVPGADTDPLLLKRTLHTLKGNTASMELSVIAGLCHTLEEQLGEVGGSMSEASVKELSARWSAIEEHVRSLSASREQDAIEIPEAEYTALLARIEDEGVDRQTIVRDLLALRLESVGRPLQGLAERAKVLARCLGKGDIEVEVQTNDIRLDPDRYAPLFSELVHVVRNAVDHGLETLEERRAAAKAPPGRLVLRASLIAGSLSLEIADDGRGIDWDALRSEFEERGLAHTTDEERVEALCHAGVSSRKEVTITSGRGIGLSAVKRQVLAMGGSLQVHSATGAGTTWTIRVPLASDCTQPVSHAAPAHSSGTVRISHPSAATLSAAARGSV